MDFYDIEMYELSAEEMELMGESAPMKDFDPEDNIPY